MTTKVDDLINDKKRRKDGVVCTVDKCFAPMGKSFEVTGEYCTECQAGIPVDQLSAAETLEEINLLRISLGETTIEE